MWSKCLDSRSYKETKNNLKEPILENMINAMGKSYHQRCFTCATCDKPFTDSFHEHEG